MTFWNTDNPAKPWGNFDPQAQLDIPFDWSAWLADLGVAYDSHVIEVESPLELVGSTHTEGVITAYVKVASGGTYSIGRKYRVTCRITTTGSPSRVDERSVYLKMVER